MKTKIIILIGVAAFTVGGITIVVFQQATVRQRQSESELPQAMSIYVRTFKLDDSPPIFPTGKSTPTNQNSKTNLQKP